MSQWTKKQLIDLAAKHLSTDIDDPLLTSGLFDLYIENALDVLTAEIKWRWLEMEGDFTVPARAEGTDVSVIYFPNHVGRIVTMYSRDLSYRDPVNDVGAYGFDTSSPEWQVGSVDFKIEWGYYKVGADMPTAAMVDLSATGGASASGLKVLLLGMDTNQVERKETVTLDSSGLGQSTFTYRAGPGGLIEVTIDPSSIPTAGGVGVVDATVAGTVMVSLDVDRGEIAKEHVRAEIHPGLASPTLFRVRYYRRISGIGDNEVLPIPHELQQTVWFGVLEQIRDFQGMGPDSLRYAAKAEQLKRKLKQWSNRNVGRSEGWRMARQNRRSGFTGGRYYT